MSLMLAASTSAPLVAATERTGDTVDGTTVIERLDVADLASGQVHRFWFRAGETSAGQGWYVPVIVVRGARPGPRLLLTAAIHGDELNGIGVIHRLIARLDPVALNGTVVMVPGLNAPGLLHHSRSFTTDGLSGENLNRLMPGKQDGSAAERYDARLWQRLLRPDADVAVDIHTQSRNTAYVMYAFAGSPRARAMAELIGPDIIKLDPGVKGALETELLKSGVPAITLELGRPEIFDEAMIDRATDGIRRLMIDLKMLPAGSAPPRTVIPFVGNKLREVTTGRGGFAHLMVALGAAVRAGETVATISDPFGRVVETVRAPVSGRVNTIATNPLRDPGDMLLRIVFTSSDPACRDGC